MALAAENVDNTSTTTKKPSDSAFKQQKFPAWQPILTAGTVLPTFFVIGIAFIPVGIGLLYFSNEIKEHQIDYTYCNQSFFKSETDRRNWTETNTSCIDVLSKDSSEDCYCIIKFTLQENMEGEVYMYYGLTNFYQNHRRYVKSLDQNQLLGNLGPSPSSDCEPFRYNDSTSNIPIAPCGAIANSMFNDILTMFEWTNNDWKNVNLKNTGIAWDSDKNIKFRNPSGDLKEAFASFAKPKAWKKHIWELDLNNTENNGFQNEDFIVWMRTAALPNFRKLYRKITEGLLKGDYLLIVEYNYDVSIFNGSKKMILSTTSPLGGKNIFLGIVYISVGGISLVLGVVLLFIHIKKGKRTKDLIAVNPRTTYQ